MGAEAEVPAGDLEGCAEDLGTYKFRHDELVAEVASRDRGRGRGREVEEGYGAPAKNSTNNLICSRGSWSDFALR